MRLHFYVAYHKFNHQGLKLQEIFFFSLYQGYPIQNSFLTVSIDNDFFFCFSRHVRSRHIEYGQDTWYMDIFHQAT